MRINNLAWGPVLNVMSYIFVHGLVHFVFLSFSLPVKLPISFISLLYSAVLILGLTQSMEVLHSIYFGQWVLLVPLVDVRRLEWILVV
jgi:hypothetical protein